MYDVSEAAPVSMFVGKKKFYSAWSIVDIIIIVMSQ